MKFEMWSVWHYLLIIAPAVIIAALYFPLRKKSYKTKYIVGVVIGIISLGILLLRNIDIYVRTGFTPDIIPLQVCHFGNIMVFVALVFRSKTAASVTWGLNLIAAFGSLIFADALEGYATILAIRPQTYIWGHILIVVGALYAVIMKIVRIDLKSFFIGVAVLFALLIPSIILNSYQRCMRDGLQLLLYIQFRGRAFRLFIYRRTGAVRLVHDKLDIYDTRRRYSFCRHVRNLQHPEAVVS